MAEDDALRFATARLFHHILNKGLQVGAVIGNGVLLPAVYAFRPKDPTDKSMKLLSYSLMGGVMLSGSVGLAKYATMDRESVEDRAYRIKYNTAQCRLDRMNTIFGIFGAGAMGLMCGGDAYSVIAGYSLGTFAAVVAHFCTTEHHTDVGKIVHELKH